MAYRGLLGSASVDAGLQCGVCLGLGGKLGLQLRIQGVYDALSFGLLSVELVDLLLRGGDVLLLLGLLIGELLLEVLDFLNGLGLLIGHLAVVEQTVEHVAQIVDARQNLQQAQAAGLVLACHVGGKLGLAIGDLLLLLRDLASGLVELLRLCSKLFMDLLGLGADLLEFGASSGKIGCGIGIGRSNEAQAQNTSEGCRSSAACHVFVRVCCAHGASFPVSKGSG